MKNKSNYFLGKIMVMVFLIFNIVLSAQENEIQEPFDFPLTPEMEGWKLLKSGSERAKATTVPEEVLVNLSSRALVQTLFKHPLLFEVLLHDYFVKGLDLLIPHVNCFEELFKRGDATDPLIDYYDRINITSIAASKKITWKDLYAELILAHKSIQAKLTDEQVIRLQNIALDKLRHKADHPEIFGRASLETCSLLVIECLLSDGQRPLLANVISDSELDLFLRTGRGLSDDVINFLLEI